MDDATWYDLGAPISRLRFIGGEVVDVVAGPVDFP